MCHRSKSLLKAAFSDARSSIPGNPAYVGMIVVYLLEAFCSIKMSPRRLWIHHAILLRAQKVLPVFSSRTSFMESKASCWPSRVQLMAGPHAIAAMRLLCMAQVPGWAWPGQFQNVPSSKCKILLYCEGYCYRFRSRDFEMHSQLMSTPWRSR